MSPGLGVMGSMSCSRGREFRSKKKILDRGFRYWGSPGLVVMGGESCSKGCVFESQQCILDGHFSHIFVVRIVMFV